MTANTDRWKLEIQGEEPGDGAFGGNMAAGRQ